MDMSADSPYHSPIEMPISPIRMNLGYEEAQKELQKVNIAHNFPFFLISLLTD
jgi:hypothetical protein